MRAFIPWTYSTWQARLSGGGRRGDVAGTTSDLHELLGLLGGEVVEHHHLPAVEDGQRRCRPLCRLLLLVPLLQRRAFLERARLLREELQHGLLLPLLQLTTWHEAHLQGHVRREAHAALLLHVLPEQAARHREPAAAAASLDGLLLVLGGHDALLALTESSLLLKKREHETKRLTSTTTRTKKKGRKRNEE
jgi:hypothetical protein